MEPITLMLFASPVLALGFTGFRRRASQLFAPGNAPSRPRAAPPHIVRSPTPRAVPKAKPETAKPAKLDDFAWDGPLVPDAVVVQPAAPAARSADLVLRRKIRDRYIAARFPCTAQSSADLENPDRMIKAARLFFEEAQPDRAMELLSLAIEQCPEVESLRLAQLEIAFLTRDAEAFRVLALEFRGVHPASKAWDQISRLGRTIAPQEPEFGMLVGVPAHAHYGPWPDTPNWIKASWDLTGEVLAVDFHLAMKNSLTAAPTRDPAS